MKSYDLTKSSICIPYLDINSLYGSGMTDGGFMWLKNVGNFDINSFSKKSPIGYILKVALECPDKLHVLRNDCPLAPEKLAIPYNMLSDCCKKFADKYGVKVE